MSAFPGYYRFFPKPGNPPEQIRTDEYFTPPNRDDPRLSVADPHKLLPAFFFFKSRGSVLASSSQSIFPIPANLAFLMSFFVAAVMRGVFFFFCLMVMMAMITFSEVIEEILKLIA